MKHITLDVKDQNIFFTSDLHFKHENILIYSSRPFETIGHMDCIFISNWNTVVNENDIVFILGDFIRGAKSEWKQILGLLNGKKYLILGNHDREKDIPTELFEVVSDILKVSIKDSNTDDKYHTFILSHRPLLTWEGRETRNVKHLFGHLHTISKNGIPVSHNNQEADLDIISQIKPTQMYDVGVDNNDYYPVSFEKIQKYFNLI